MLIEQNPRPPSPTRRTDDWRATAHRHAHDVHHQRLRFHAPDRRRQQTRGRGEEIRRRPRRQGTHRLLVFIRRVRSKVISHQSRPYVPRAAGNPRRHRAGPTRDERARANDAKRRIDFFTSIPTETRPRFRVRGRRARGERRRILGRSRVSPVLSALEGSVGVGDPGASRRGARVAARRSVVPKRCVAERSFSFGRSVVRSFARVGGRVRDARRWVHRV